MENIISKLDKLQYRKIIWLLAIVETLHNIEEAVWLPKWSLENEILHFPITVSEFSFRCAVMATTLFFLFVIKYFAKHNNNVSRYMMGGSLLVILANLIIPHLIASLLSRSIAPGLLTGVLLNLPVCCYLLSRGIREREFSGKSLARGTLFVIAIVLPLIALSFYLGKLFERTYF